MHIYMYKYIHIYIYIFVFIYICAFLYVTWIAYICDVIQLHFLIYQNCAHIYIYMHIYIYVYIYVYIYIYICVYIYIYMCIFIRDLDRSYMRRFPIEFFHMPELCSYTHATCRSALDYIITSIRILEVPITHEIGGWDSNATETLAFVLI